MGSLAKGWKIWPILSSLSKKKDDKWFHFTGFDKNRLQNHTAEYDQSSFYHQFNIKGFDYISSITNYEFPTIFIILVIESVLFLKVIAYFLNGFIVLTRL